MRIQKIGLAILVSVIILGCAIFGPSGPTVYDDSDFSFQYPETWQTMTDLWGDRYQPGQEYYQLGVNEIIMVTSVQKQGESGAWFAVASTPLAETIDLEHLVSETYAPFMDTLQDYTERNTTVAGTDGFEVTYKRPVGRAMVAIPRYLDCERFGVVCFVFPHVSDKFRLISGRFRVHFE